jgi:hypothetical protein
MDATWYKHVENILFGNSQKEEAASDISVDERMMLK